MWTTLSGEPDSKKVAKENALITACLLANQVREEHPEMSIERLCELMSVSRSWYYARPSIQQKTHKDVELRDAIERIVLEFPGYG